MDKLLGNVKIKSYLESMLASGNIGNSLLFSGLDGVGKGLFAQAFAYKLIPDARVFSENHPDVSIYRPEGKTGMHTMASMRQLTDEVYMHPYEANWKVFIIHDAERMLPVCANALLKTFEEPGEKSFIILVSSHADMLLPTIISRCRRLYFAPLSESQITEFLMDKKSLKEEEAKLLAVQAQGSLARAEQLLNHGDHSIHKSLIKCLSTGSFESYSELLDLAKELEAFLDQEKKSLESSLCQEWKEERENMTVIQLEALEKEIKGALFRRYMFDAEGLLSIIFSWYRDMHLIRSGASYQLLNFHPYLKPMQRLIQEGSLFPLEGLQKHIEDALLALQRSVKFSLCFENLLLRLDFI